MHELSIICSAIGEIEYHCVKNNISRVNKVILAIGQFIAIDFNALEFAFQSASKNTICEDAVLEIEEITPRAYCGLCEIDYEIGFTNKSCPTCGLINSNITKGYEILLYRIEGD